MRARQVGTGSEDRTWRKTKKSVIVLLVACAIVVGLSGYFGSPPSLEELIVGLFAIGVFVAFQLGDYFEFRLQSLENGLEIASCATETSIVETLNELGQRLKHIEKEVDFIART